MNQKRFAIWYFVLSLIFILLENINLPLLTVASKALIIPSLMLFYHFSVRGNYKLVHRLIMAGLLFSWLGDVFLELADLKEFQANYGDILFMAGLSAFLITHVMYIFGFSTPKGRNTIFSSRIYGFFLVGLYGFIMLYYLYRNLGDMKIPVIAYTVIILLMLIAALNRYGKVNGLSYILVVIGAVLFIISDSLIAFNKFQEKINFAGIMIMITYVSAQYLIVIGCIRENIPIETKA